MELNLPFDVEIGIFRVISGVKSVTKKTFNEIVPIGLTDTDSGYIRWDGVVTFTPMQKTCSIDMYNARSTYNLVIGLKLCKTADILKHIQIELAKKTATLNYTITSTSINQEQIRIDEALKTDLDLIKIVYVKNEITINPCEYVIDCVC